jgi:hypothetical protein
MVVEFVGFSSPAITKIISVLQRHNYWLVLVFGIYILSLFLFAWLYYVTHRRIPNSFAFNSDVSRTQDSTYRTDKVRRSELLGISISALESMDSDFSRGDCKFRKSDGSENVTMQSHQGYEASFSVRRPMPSAAAKKKSSMMSRPWKELRLTGPDGKELLKPRVLPFGDAFPGDVDQFREILHDLLKGLRAEAESNLDLATSPSSSLQIWCYWDFFYFSTITQSTVGYGDILPNSTLVRMIVTAQVLAGCALVVVILNLVILGS